MKECCEKIIRVGFSRNPKKIFDEIDQLTASMIRAGWELKDTCIEDGLENVHMFFEKEIEISN
jgi:hypothetical protein